ncbi:flavin monoamine oxidase family protein [Roseovarius sp. M141]|uniref:flavin monoamine oxidase family protein n=1 Tax=Roseovarius sp. M141 TaxID=2583806 RepID=UPI0034E9565A
MGELFDVSTETELCIIGAGLSGLALASAVRAQGREVTVLEARDRPGGRMLSQNGYDLGPSWIWPHNHRMLALLSRLGIDSFPQYATGRLVFEDARGMIRRDLEFATMSGALRVAGGLTSVSDALAEEIGDSLFLSRPVESVAEDATGVTVSTAGQTIRSARVVLALPPRLATRLGISVPEVPTWMAGQTKLVATYATPFWRDQGLNGDAISHCGPLAEIHDASPDGASVGALFGFAYPGAGRLPEFRDAAVDQLVRLFGPRAATPDEVIFKDWSMDLNTAVAADQTPSGGHHMYRAVPSTDRLIFAGTEAAPDNGGFLEGALAAAGAAHLSLDTVAA